ncbi:MAG: cation-transporting P-type ATPase, partial [Anaerococcus sp.]
MDNINWYELSKDESFEKLSSSTLGLKEDEARKRLEKYGPNALKKEEKKPLIEKLKDQFFDPMIIILIVAAIFSAFSGEKLDS